MAGLAQNYETLTDIELASRIARRDPLAVRVVTKRNNQRLYHAAWSILKNRADAEEAVQEGYLKAFTSMETFAGKSSLTTWLTCIVLNEAFGKQRSAQRIKRQLEQQSVLVIEEYREKLMGGLESNLSPEADAARNQVGKLLESAIAELPEAFRVIVMLRDVDGLSVDENSRSPANSPTDRQDPPYACEKAIAEDPYAYSAGCAARRVSLCRQGLRRHDPTCAH